MEFEYLRIHHIGYLVKRIDKACAMFLDLGYSIEQEVIYDEYRNVDICFLIKNGYRIELISPRKGKSAVGELLKRIGNSPYHICYEVKHIGETVIELSKMKFVEWEQPTEAPALNGRKVTFLFNSQIGMIELLESK